MAIDFTTDPGRVRLLINDVDENNLVFSDSEVAAFLTLEGDSVKRAAAQALDTIADNEVLVAKVLRTQDLATDGAKAAAELRKRAAALRAQADVEDAASDEGAFFDIVPTNGPVGGPELTGWTFP